MFLWTAHLGTDKIRYSLKKSSAIIGGTVGGLVVLGAIITILLYFRRKKGRQTAEYLRPTRLYIPPALPNDSAASNPFTERNNTVTVNRTPISLVPTPAGPPVGSSSGTTPAQPTPTHTPMRSEVVDARDNTSNVPLTDEQINFVTGLSQANAPATDVARVMERMRVGRAISSHEVQSVDMDLGTAPPSYGS